MISAGLHSGPGGWFLAAEGAVVHIRERTAVIADVHLGYEWARANGGDCLPAHSLNETIDRLDSLLRRAPITCLIVAGDLVESSRPCPRTARDLEALSRWLTAQGVELIALAGNHDPPQRPPLPETTDVAGWTIGHGHVPIDAPRTISGHHHPVLKARGLTFPCFLVGRSRIILPAFSANAAGVALGALGPSVLVSQSHGTLRCVAGAGETLLDFGPAHELIHAASGRNRIRRRRVS
jgi:putative SbcD/Mre11-related phosphoesterase